MMDYRFINPYNFVPLSEGKTKEPKQKENETLLSGIIEYSLLTKTPLFIPNTSNDHAICPELYKENEAFHKSYEFFAYEDLSTQEKIKEKKDLKYPVIPGSEIRGMLRNYYEVMTDSCMLNIDDSVLSRRNCQVFSAGLIRKRQNDDKTVSYDLIKAKDCLLRTKGEDNLRIATDWKDDNDHNNRKCFKQSELTEGQRVFIRRRNRDRGKPIIVEIKIPKESSEKKPNGYNTGYVLKGEEGPVIQKDLKTLKNQKHCCHVFIGTVNKEPIKTDLNVSSLNLILDLYKQTGEKPYYYKEYESSWKTFNEKGKNGALFPVYYSTIDGEYYMLSPASITREVYKTSLKKLLKNHEPCTNSENLCPACALFGTVQNGFARASRVRMTDLHLVKTDDINPQNLYDGPVTLKELSSPKLGNMEFYLKKPNDKAVFWTYDYYIDQDGTIHTYEASVNGRKFYWHNLDVVNSDYVDSNQSIRNITVRLLKAGTKFKGTIYFDGITERQLKELCYLVNCGEAEEIEKKTHGYKLGMGKPLGLGSVTLKVNQVLVRKIEISSKEQSLLCKWEEREQPNSFEVFKRQEDKENYEMMTSFDAINGLTEDGYKISYPRLRADGDIFEWFVKNHKAWKRDREGNKVENTMPNKREQMYYAAYLDPMKPALSTIKFSVQKKSSDGLKGANPKDV